MNKTIGVAGATGDLGQRIVRALVARGADVRILVRASSSSTTISELEKLGVQVVTITNWTVPELAEACQRLSCVVSALSGLRDTVIDTQKILLDAAVAAGVPRFIPSDYSIDFTNLPAGRNRNLDLRREFHAYLDKAPIAATTIFNGPFADMVTGQMPIILFGLKRVIVWGNADQRIDFTTKDDTAAFAASAALDDATPRFLRIAGDELSIRELTTVVSEVTGQPYRLVQLGGLGVLSTLIRMARFVAPGSDDVYPAWQGMQYMRDMLDGRGKASVLDNNRYSGIRWHTVKDVLAAYVANSNQSVA
ncbi:NmrA family NAD(P)-binding protein [Spirosoma pollinicola]|uniref:NmrA family protein n=1 Tax=Spirosoma pollinicola TaxID=2057025 RepID=A0A2K8YTP5_9BACT|nr:NmrA family NAD(P)-binding protein [Spirosoma pollinicola]AUD00997.1 NmrA family protein [Spirosoma pollinicola]